MAFGTWRFLHGRGQAPAPSDVPDDNTLGIMEFMRAFRRKCEGSAYRAAQALHGLQPSVEDRDLGHTLTSFDGSAVPAGNNGKSPWTTLLPALPQRKPLCAAV
jgi:hypothetical protein